MTGLPDSAKRNEELIALNPELFGRTAAKTAVAPAAAQVSASLENFVKVENEVVRIVLYDERPFSWNKYWSGMHFKERSSEKKRVRELVQMTLFSAGYSQRPFEHRVCIQINVFMLHPAYDPDNAALKPYVDALEGFVIKNDNLKHVRAILPVVRLVKVNPRLEIIVGRLPWEEHLP